MALDLPDPLHALNEALQDLLDRWACLFMPCRYAPIMVLSRKLMFGRTHVTYATFCCVRCCKAKTMTLMRATVWAERNTSWEHYRGWKPKAGIPASTPHKG